MRIVLKGSPEWSIDTTGTLSVQTTWMCYQDSKTDGNVLMGWLEFQNEVEVFAGNTGDPYKMPKSTENEVEVTQYTQSDLFIVQDVSYSAVEGRTHYEVTFTHIQNAKQMQRIGGIEASANENNERTKTARYRVNVGTEATALDTLMDSLKSGTAIDWAGASYLIESTEYTSESGTLYSVGISAKDMSEMMISMPQISTDNFGNQTISVAWRYSLIRYAELENSDNFPKQGDDAARFIGNREGFIIQSVNAQPVGVLGYTLEITAVNHIVGARISSSRRDTMNDNSNSYYTEWESKFKANSPSPIGVGAKVGDGSMGLIPSGVSFANGTVREISYDEYITGKYDITIRMSNQPQEQALEDTWEASVSQGEMQLTEEQCGWAKSPSGELYQINYPPATKFTYIMSPNSLIEMQTVTGGSSPHVTESQLLNLLKQKGTIGYDRIVGVHAFVSDNLKWLSDAQIKQLANLKDVQSIMLEGFVHAQPTMTEEGKSVRNIIFRPWNPEETCPLTFPTHTKPQNGRYNALKKSIIKYKFQYHDIEVTMRYKVPIHQALVAPNKNYYLKAIDKVRCSNYTSYKGVGISYKSIAVQDDYEDIIDYTEVTCTIRALLESNAYKPTWNSKYDNSTVMV